MKIKLLFLSILLIATNLFASEGFLVFGICRNCSPIVFEYSKTGVMGEAEVTSPDTGVVNVAFSEALADEFYEIRVSHDDPEAFKYEIRSRSTLGFLINITQNGNQFDPVGFVFVAVDR